MEEQNVQEPQSKGSNKTLIIILVIVGILVILGVVANFAWGWFAKRAATELAEEAIEQQTGGEIEFSEGSWPSSLSSELQYPDSTVTSAADYTSEGRTGATVGLETTASLNEVYDYYSGLSSKGWTVSYKYVEQTSKVASVSLQKDADTVSVGIAEEAGKTTIAIMVGQE